MKSKTSAILTLTIKLDTGKPRGMKMLNGIAGAIAKELSEKQRAELTKQLQAERDRLGRKTKPNEGRRNAQRRKAGKARSKRRVFSEEMGVK